MAQRLVQAAQAIEVCDDQFVQPGRLQPLASLGDTLLSAGGGQIEPPSLAVDPCGNVYVFYDDDTAGSTQVMMWTEPERFSCRSTASRSVRRLPPMSPGSAVAA